MIHSVKDGVCHSSREQSVKANAVNTYPLHGFVRLYYLIRHFRQFRFHLLVPLSMMYNSNHPLVDRQVFAYR